MLHMAGLEKKSFMTFFLFPSYPPPTVIMLLTTTKNVFNFFLSKSEGKYWGKGFLFFLSLNSFLNTRNTNHSQGVCANLSHMISRKWLTQQKNPLNKAILEFCLLSGKEGGKGVVVKKHNPAKQNVKSFKSTSLTFSGLGTQD